MYVLTTEPIIITIDSGEFFNKEMKKKNTLHQMFSSNNVRANIFLYLDNFIVYYILFTINNIKFNE